MNSHVGISYRWQHRNEKLASIRIGSGVGHWNCVRSIVTQRRNEFVFEFATPYWFAACAGAGWISGLYHEPFDDTMENVSIVIAIFAMYTEILNRFRTLGGEQFQMNVPARSVQCCGIVQLLDA